MATQASDETKASGIVSPIKLAHVVFRTSRPQEMIDWYRLVLNAKPSYISPGISFLAYDDEHHRVAFVTVPDLAEQPAGVAGVHHVAFTFANLKVLLENYERLRDLGIKPLWPVNHGPTTSIYYGDPDGNQIEFQVDNYETVEEAGEFFFSDAFDVNPIGVDYDPEELLARMRAGEDENQLLARPPSGPRGVDSIRLR